MLILIAFIATVNRQAILFAIGLASSEERPRLLSDAEWDRPSSAHKFSKRFGLGVPEIELLQWLQANDFTVDQTARRATRTIGTLPCAERATVTWSAKATGTLLDARAVVAEAGCL